LKNFEGVIEEGIRVARPGGFIVLGIPNLAHLINRVRLLFGLQPMCIHVGGPHLRGFTHKAFLQLLRSNEKVTLVDYTGTLMYPLPYSIGNFFAKCFVGLAGYTCYLLKKN
jgi:hypothetical protein